MLFSLGLQAFAKVEVLFHPHDPTLPKIADWISGAKAQVDIAMYNMDVTDMSPIIQKLKSPEVQTRIQTGDLKIRMIFEGYSTREGNAKKMQVIEDLGIDARYLGKDVKIHHKFAVIDSDQDSAQVITGSANWSLSSASNYNENILFFQAEPEISYRFQTEFDRLWKKSKAFGVARESVLNEAKPAEQAEIDVYFNSPRHLKLNLEEPNVLTDQVVAAIEGAKTEIQIATTRIRLEPILNAVKRAADRGIKIQILLSQDDFKDLNQRAQWLYGNPNIQLRVKFYNLKVSQYMTYQMHNKLMIVDTETILTGSFNWSHSSENFHIENLVRLQGTIAQQVLPNYLQEFSNLWDLGRPGLETFKERLAKEKSEGLVPKCAFAPIALEVPEISFLISEYRNCQKEQLEP